jgi:hypothetical protein
VHFIDGALLVNPVYLLIVLIIAVVVTGGGLVLFRLGISAVGYKQF